MRTLIATLILAGAGLVHGEKVAVIKDFAQSGFEFQYGTWENNNWVAA